MYRILDVIFGLASRNAVSELSPTTILLRSGHMQLWKCCSPQSLVLPKTHAMYAHNTSCSAFREKVTTPQIPTTIYICTRITPYIAPAPKRSILLPVPVLDCDRTHYIGVKVIVDPHTGSQFLLQ